MDPILTPLLLANAPTLFSLISDYLIARKDRKDAVGVDDFRTWLKSDALPALMGQSDVILGQLLAMRSSNDGRLNKIDEHLVAIRALLSERLPPTETDLWDKLADLDRRILESLFNASKASEHAAFDLPWLGVNSKATAAEIKDATRLLEHEGWLKIHEYSNPGGYRVELTADGFVFAWRMVDRAEFDQAMKGVLSALPGDRQMKNLGLIAKEADISPALALWLTSSWEARGYLSIEHVTGQAGTARIKGVSPSFLRKFRPS